MKIIQTESKKQEAAMSLGFARENYIRYYEKLLTNLSNLWR